VWIVVWKWVLFRELSVRKHVRSRARAQKRAATGARSLPRRFPIRHILFRNLNYASTGNVRAIKIKHDFQRLTRDRRFRDGLEKSDIRSSGISGFERESGYQNR